MTVEEAAKLIGAIAGALGVIGVIAKQMFDRFPPRAVGLAAELESIRSDLADARNDVRALTDYVHDLREDMARAGQTPRDWPEGLRL